MRIYRRWLAVCIAVFAALLTSFLSLYELVMLAGVTGAITICGTAAPRWWLWTYVALVPLGVIASAICAAFLALRWYRAACGIALPVR